MKFDLNKEKPEKWNNETWEKLKNLRANSGYKLMKRDIEELKLLENEQIKCLIEEYREVESKGKDRLIVFLIAVIVLLFILLSIYY